MWRIISLLLGALQLPLNAAPLRDPTMPGQYQAPRSQQVSPAAASLSSIVISSQGNYAVVGNRILSVGDSLGTARIKAIAPDYIVLTNGKTIRLFQAITER